MKPPYRNLLLSTLLIAMASVLLSACDSNSLTDTYDAAHKGAIGLSASPFIDVDGAAIGSPDAYYLAVYACRQAGIEREGSYGVARAGAMATERPSAATLGAGGCP